MEITVKLTAESKLLNAIELIGNMFAGQMPKPEKAVKTTTKQEVVKPPAPAKAETASEPVKVESEKPISVEQVRKAVMAQSQAGKRDEIKALLAEFKAVRVTDLTNDQYPEFLQKVNAL